MPAVQGPGRGAPSRARAWPSVIRPAAFCGVAGFKPSYKLIPTVGMKCFSWSLDTVGLFARSVSEVAEFARAASGQRITTPASRKPGGWSVGIPDAYPWGECSVSAQQTMAHATKALRSAGVRVVPCTLPTWVAEVMVKKPSVEEAIEFVTAIEQGLVIPVQ